MLAPWFALWAVVALPRRRRVVLAGLVALAVYYPIMQVIPRVL